MTIVKTFGPPGAYKYQDYDAWRLATRNAGLLQIGVSNGVVAQGDDGLNKGFWSFTLDRGWIGSSCFAGGIDVR